MKEMKRAVLIISVILAAGILIYILTKKRVRPVEKRVEQVADIKGIPQYYLVNTEPVDDVIDHYQKSWRIHFFDAGQGDAILLQGNNRNILIDGGDRNSGVLQHLLALDIDTLHWVIATHAHADHIGGLIPVFRTIPVVGVIDNGLSHDSGLFRTYRMVADSAAGNYVKATAGWSYSRDEDFEMVILHPDTTTIYGINDASVVLRVKMGEVYSIFMGDAEIKAETAILNRNTDIRSSLIKVGHHGSKTSSSLPFLKAVAPVAGFIQCAAENKYGFPHTETLASFQAINTQIFSTSVSGNILVLINHDGFSIFPEKQDLFPELSLPVADVVDINSAGISALTRIVHVGEATAKAIIENRPYKTVDELVRVRGLGEKKLDDIKKQGIAVCYPV
jgi:competence protein ComEC